MIIAFPSAALRAVAVLAARKDIRHYLCAVLLDVSPTETRLVATDGHALGAYRVEGLNEGVSTAFELLIPLSAILALKITKRDPVVRVTDNPDGTYMLESGGLAIRFAAMDGKFPDYRRVVPSTVTGEPEHFDPALVARFADAAACLGIRSGLVHVAPNGRPDAITGGPALVHFAGRPEFVGVVMPCKASMTEDETNHGAAWVSERWTAPAPLALVA